MAGSGIWLDDQTYAQTAGQIWAQGAHQQLQAGEDWAQQAIQNSLKQLQAMVPWTPAAPSPAPTPATAPVATPPPAPPTPAPEPPPTPAPIPVAQTPVAESPPPSAPAPALPPPPAETPATPAAPTPGSDMLQAGQNWAQQQINNLLNPAQNAPQTPSATSDLASATSPSNAPASLPSATSSTPVPSGPQPASPGDFIDQARQAAQAAGIDPEIFSRQIQQESGFNPNARSGAGALGIAQFMPETAKGMGIDPMDAAQSLKAAAQLDAQNLSKYGGDWSKALAAYNAGGGNVDKYGGIPPFEETQRYVQNILGGAKDVVQSAVQRGETAVNNAVQGVQSAVARVSQFGMGLSSGDAMAFCGPAAALAFAQTYGRNPTIDEAKQLAQQVGWNPDQGMAGPSSEVALLKNMGIDAHMTSGVDWKTVGQDASSGNPVIIDTPGHYYYIDGYNADSGKFHVGTSGTDLKGGSEWMSADQINAMPQSGGSARAAIYADHPLSGPGQAATMATNQPALAQFGAGSTLLGQPSGAAQPTEPLAQFGGGSQLVTSTPLLGGAQDLSGSLLQQGQRLVSNLLAPASPAIQNQASTIADAVLNVGGKAQQTGQDVLTQAQSLLGQGAANIAPQSISDMLGQNALVSQGIPNIGGRLLEGAFGTPEQPSGLSQQLLGGGPLAGATQMAFGTPQQPSGLSNALLSGGLGGPLYNAPVLGGVMQALRGPALLSDQDILQQASPEDIQSQTATLRAFNQAIGQPDAPITPAQIVAGLRSNLESQAFALAGGLEGPAGLAGYRTLYHGTAADFPRVEPGQSVFEGENSLGPGHYLATDPDVANTYAERATNEAVMNWQPTNIGANVRKTYIPEDMNLFDLTTDSDMAPQEIRRIADAAPDPPHALYPGTIRSALNEVADNVEAGQGGGSPSDVFEELASRLGNVRAAGVLRGLGYEGIEHIDNIDGARNVVVFPEAYDHMVNAISGRQGGQINPMFSMHLGSAGLGGLIGYNTAPEDATEQERLERAALGAGIGLAGTGLVHGAMVPPAGIPLGDWIKGAYRGGVIGGLNTMADVGANATITPLLSYLGGISRDMLSLNPARAVGRTSGALQGMADWTNNFLAGLSATRPGSLRAQAGGGVPGVLANLFEGPGALHGAFQNATAELIQSMEQGAGATAQAAQAAGERAAARDDLGTLTSGLGAGVTKLGPIGDALFPVYRMGMALASRMVESSPLGLAGTAWDVARGTTPLGRLVGEGPYAGGAFNAPTRGGAPTNVVGPLAERLTNNVLGTALSVWLANQAVQGNVTGSGPTDPAQRQVWLANGNQPNSFRSPVDGKFYSWDKLAPQLRGPLMAAGAYADAAQAYSAAQGRQATAGPQAYGVADPREAAAWQLVSEVGHQLMSATPLRTFANLYDALAGGGGGTANAGLGQLSDIASGIVGGAVPLSGTVRSIAQMTDPTQRLTLSPEIASQLPQSVLENVEQNIPGLRQTLPARVDVLGRDVANPQQGLGQILPARAAAGQASPVLQAMQAAGVAPSAAPPAINYGPFGEIRLTPQERQTWEQLRGRILQQSGANMVSSSGFQQSSPKSQQMSLNLLDQLASNAANLQMLSLLAPSAAGRQQARAGALTAPVVGYSPDVLNNQAMLQQQIQSNAQHRALIQSLLGSQA